MKELQAAQADIEEMPGRGVSAERAVEWLRAIAEIWTAADVVEAKAELLHAIYERIVVAGRTIVSARLTPAESSPMASCRSRPARRCQSLRRDARP